MPYGKAAFAGLPCAGVGCGRREKTVEASYRQRAQRKIGGAAAAENIAKSSIKSLDTGRRL